MKQKTMGLHKIALAALFTVGNSLLRFPWKNAGSDPLLPFLISAIGALIPAFLLYPLFRRLLRRPLSGHPGRLLPAAVLSLPLGGYALFCAWRGASDYLTYVTEMILPGCPPSLPALLFLVCAVWLSCIPEKGTDTFCLLGFSGVVVCVIALFAFGAPHFRGEYLKPATSEMLPGIGSSLRCLLKESLLPLSVLSVYFASVVPQKGERALAIGTLTGYALLLFCVLQTLLTFGPAYAATLPYPYSFAVRIISVGQYFFRLEGFSYLPDYLACLVRTALCLATARRLTDRFSPGKGRFLPPVAGALMFGVFCFF